MKSMIKRIEAQNNIKVIWAGYVGSRLRGYDIKSSDRDVQLIHIPNNPIMTYLTSSQKENIVMKDDELGIDLISSDLKHILKLAEKSNTKVFEMIQQVPIYGLYDSNSNISPFLIKFSKLLKLTFNKDRLSYVYACMAKNELSQLESETEESKILKKLIRIGYSLLSANFVLDKSLPNPVNINDLIEEYKNTGLGITVSDLLKIRKSSGSLESISLPHLKESYKNEINSVFSKIPPNFDNISEDNKEKINRLFIEILNDFESNYFICDENGMIIGKEEY